MVRRLCILCFLVALWPGLAMAQSEALMEAYNRFRELYKQGQYPPTPDRGLRRLPSRAGGEGMAGRAPGRAVGGAVLPITVTATRQQVPWKKPNDAQRYLDGLRKARYRNDGLGHEAK